MISKFKNKKTCKRLGIINSQKGGSKKLHGQKQHKLTTKNVKKVIQSAFLSNFADKFRQNPSNIKQNGSLNKKKFRKEYKTHLEKFQGLAHVIPSVNKLNKAFKRMNKFREGRKYGLQEIYNLLHNKSDKMEHYASLKERPLSFSPQTKTMLPDILLKELYSNPNIYGYRNVKADRNVINKISYILNPELYQPQKK